MFVWNYFTHDSRVLREAAALAGAGYEVDVVAIYNQNDKKLLRKEKINNFTVIRIPRYPYSLLGIMKIESKAKVLLKKTKIFSRISKVLFKKIRRDRFIWIILLFLIIFTSLYITKTSIPQNFYLWSIYMLASVLFLNLTYRLGKFLFKNKKFLKKLAWLYVAFGMVKVGLKKDYDFYHSNDLNTLMQGNICKLLRRKKLIYDSHEIQTSRIGYYGKEFYYYEKILIKIVDKIMTVNDSIAEYIKDLYKIDEPVVIHNYPFYKIPKKKRVNLHKLLDIPKREPILLYQGGITYGRGIEKIVEAIPQFKKGVLVFIGDGPIKNKIVKIHNKGEIGKSIRFLPYLPIEELIEYTQNAYLGFCLTQNTCMNNYYSLPNKLFEYIMAAVPIVACDLPEIRKIVGGNKVGITINEIEGSSIARAVNFLIDNPDQYKIYRDNCIRLREKYNWEREKKIFIKVYDNLNGN